MAAHTAGLPVQRRRAEHIHQLTAEIAARERIIAHLLTTAVRAVVYFFTVACLTAALITYVNGKHSAALVWGGIGLALVMLLVGFRVARYVFHRAITALRTEMAEVLPGSATDKEPAEPPAPGTDSPLP